MFALSPFLLLADLSRTLFANRDARWRPARTFAATALGPGLLAFVALLCYGYTSRLFLHNFVPQFMILAFAGLACRRPSEAGWRPWRAAVWAVLAVSALLHVQLSFRQAVRGGPVDRNAQRAFVRISPLVRRLWRIASGSIARRRRHVPPSRDRKTTGFPIRGVTMEV